MEDAVSAGFRPQGLRRVEAILRGFIADGVVPGLAAVVMREGAIGGEWYLGKMGTGRGVTAETLFSLASITKPMTVATAMTLVEEGRISLDEPLTTVLPELDRTETRRLTLRHLMTHTSGFPGFPAENDALRAAQRPLTAFIEVFLRATPRFPAGTRFCYSNVAIGLISEVIARLSGERYFDALRHRLFEPWGLRDAFLPLPESQWPRAALVADTNYPGQPHETSNSAYYRGLGIPWGGSYATARTVAAFAQPFLNALAGQKDDCPLSPAARRAMATLQVEVPPAFPEASDDLNAQPWSRIAWGLGWEIKASRRPHWTGELTSPATIGHLGASGTCVWADPASGALAVLLTNRALSSGWADQRPRRAYFANAVMSALA